MVSKIGFIDHHYHIKTKSGDFLREVLYSNFKIDNYWVNSDLKFDEKIFNYEKLFFFQILPNFNILKKLKNKNIIWAPMYDSPHYPYGYSWILWKIIEYFDIKVISFSKKITNQIKDKNINYISLKFHKKTRYDKINKKINIFFWNRGDVRISDWINAIDINLINKIYYLNLDKIYPENIDKTLMEKFIIIKKKFLNRKSFLSLLRKCEIFISPRKKEGIGMAQVEALSMGKYLLGFRDATMTDYILNKKIGSFLDNNACNILEINNVLHFKKYRLLYNEKCYQQYNNSQIKILNLYKKKKIKFKSNIYFELLFFLFYFYKVLIRKFITIPLLEKRAKTI